MKVNKSETKKRNKRLKEIEVFFTAYFLTFLPLLFRIINKEPLLYGISYSLFSKPSSVGLSSLMISRIENIFLKMFTQRFAVLGFILLFALVFLYFSLLLLKTLNIPVEFLILISLTPSITDNILEPTKTSFATLIFVGSSLLILLINVYFKEMNDFFVRRMNISLAHIIRPLLFIFVFPIAISIAINIYYAIILVFSLFLLSKTKMMNRISIATFLITVVLLYVAIDAKTYLLQETNGNINFTLQNIKQYSEDYINYFVQKTQGQLFYESRILVFLKNFDAPTFLKTINAIELNQPTIFKPTSDLISLGKNMNAYKETVGRLVVTVTNHENIATQLYKTILYYPGIWFIFVGILYLFLSKRWYIHLLNILFLLLSSIIYPSFIIFFSLYLDIMIAKAFIKIKKKRFNLNHFKIIISWIFILGVLYSNIIFFEEIVNKAPVQNCFLQYSVKKPDYQLNINIPQNISTVLTPISYTSYLSTEIPTFLSVDEFQTKKDINNFYKGIYEYALLYTADNINTINEEATVNNIKKILILPEINKRRDILSEIKETIYRNNIMKFITLLNSSKEMKEVCLE